MTHFVEFELENGGKVVVETELPQPKSGTQPVSRGGMVIEKAKESFENSLQAIKPIAASVMKTLSELNHPDELSFEFGITMSAETGVVLAAASGSANIKVSLKWKKADHPA